MPRLNLVEPGDASGKTAALYEKLIDGFGTVFNLFKGLGNSPVALEAYLTLDELIASGSLSEADQDTVRLVASQQNGCDYCLAAHTVTGQGKGLSEEEIIAIRKGEVKDEKRAALVKFTHAVVESKGFVTDEEIQAFRLAGYGDEQVAEVCTILAQKTLSNYFNHINDTELDFPAAPEI